MKKQDSRDQLKRQLIAKIEQMGYPRELGYLLGEQLGTQSAISRMIGYLGSAHPRSAEEITDEMLAICDDRDRWMNKKKAEYYNQKYNDLLWHGLNTEEDSPWEDEEEKDAGGS